MNQWKYVKLGEVCTIERGGSPRPIDDFITTDENGINWIKIGDADESMYITKTAQRIKPEGMKKSRYVKPGDFLLSNSMSFGRPYILKIDGCIHDGWLVLRDENNVFDKKFLYYYLSAPIIYKRFKSMAVGGVVNNLNSDMVRKVRVPIPSQEEQHQISDRLDKVSNLIFLRKQQLAKLDELVKARFVEMFGKASLLAQNQTKRLEECCISISGGNTPSMQHPEYYGGNIPFVKSGDVKGDYIVESTLTLTKTALTETTAKILPKSTLIVVIRSAALLKEFRIGMLMVDAVINQDLKALQVSEDFLPVYLMWAIKMQHQVLLNKVQTMLTSHIRMEDLLNLKIGTPPLSLQNQFAAFVERVDQQKQTVQQSLEKLELMKKALMQEYFG